MPRFALSAATEAELIDIQVRPVVPRRPPGSSPLSRFRLANQRIGFHSPTGPSQTSPRSTKPCMTPSSISTASASPIRWPCHEFLLSELNAAKRQVKTTKLGSVVSAQCKCRSAVEGQRGKAGRWRVTRKALENFSTFQVKNLQPLVPSVRREGNSPVDAHYGGEARHPWSGEVFGGGAVDLAIVRWSGHPRFRCCYRHSPKQERLRHPRSGPRELWAWRRDDRPRFRQFCRCWGRKSGPRSRKRCRQARVCRQMAPSLGRRLARNAPRSLAAFRKFPGPYVPSLPPVAKAA